MTNKAFDPFVILSIDKNCNWKAIKAAYLSKVKEYHPDLYPSYVQRIWATQKMQEINQAYEFLKNNPSIVLQQSRNDGAENINMANSETIKTKSDNNTDKISYYLKWTWISIAVVVFFAIYVPLFGLNSSFLKISTFKDLLSFLFVLAFSAFYSCILSVGVIFILLLDLLFFSFLILAPFKESYDKKVDEIRKKDSQMSYFTDLILRLFLFTLPFLGIFALNYIGVIQEIPYLILAIVAANILGEILALIKYWWSTNKVTQATNKYADEILSEIAEVEASPKRS